MTQVTTLNSVYEIDEDAKLIRRVRGVNEPTERFAPDGDWKQYLKVLPWMNGGRLVLWADGGSTILSTIVEEA